MSIRQVPLRTMEPGVSTDGLGSRISRVLEVGRSSSKSREVAELKAELATKTQELETAHEEIRKLKEALEALRKPTVLCPLAITFVYPHGYISTTDLWIFLKGEGGHN